MKLVRILILFSVLLLAPIAFSVSYCGVEFGTESTVIKDSGGNSIVRVDPNGNILIRSSAATINGNIPGNIFKYMIIKVGGVAKSAFSLSQAYMGNVNEGVTITNPSSSFLVRSGSTYLLRIDNDGHIYAKGKVVYQGGDANCVGDGWYCTDADSREYRNYFCEIANYGCSNTPTTTENCPATSGSNYCSGGGGDNTDVVKDNYNGACSGAGGSAVCGQGTFSNTETVQDCGNTASSGQYCQGDTIRQTGTSRGCSGASCYANNYDNPIHTCNVFLGCQGDGDLWHECGCFGGNCLTCVHTNCHTCSDSGSTVSGTSSCSGSSCSGSYSNSDSCQDGSERYKWDTFCSGGYPGGQQVDCGAQTTTRGCYDVNGDGRSDVVDQHTHTCSGGVCYNPGAVHYHLIQQCNSPQFCQNVGGSYQCTT